MYNSSAIELSKTIRIEKSILAISTSGGYNLLKNRRIPLSRDPKISYQPDFILIKGNKFVVIEMEINTDSMKELIGDILRSGLIGATIFIGIVKNTKTQNLMEKYGQFLKRKVIELNNMKIYSVSFKNEQNLVKELKKYL